MPNLLFILWLSMGKCIHIILCTNLYPSGQNVLMNTYKSLLATWLDANFIDYASIVKEELNIDPCNFLLLFVSIHYMDQATNIVLWWLQVVSM